MSPSNLSGNSSSTMGLKRAPLDIYKKVAIVRKPGDTVVYEDSQGRVQCIADLGDAALAATPSLQPKVKLDIPVPTIKHVSSYSSDIPSGYAVPRSYTRYIRPTAKELETTVEYNLDYEDEVWWNTTSRFGRTGGTGSTGNTNAASSSNNNSNPNDTTGAAMGNATSTAAAMAASYSSSTSATSATATGGGPGRKKGHKRGSSSKSSGSDGKRRKLTKTSSSSSTKLASSDDVRSDSNNTDYDAIMMGVGSSSSKHKDNATHTTGGTGGTGISPPKTKRRKGLVKTVSSKSKVIQDDILHDQHTTTNPPSDKETVPNDHKHSNNTTEPNQTSSSSTTRTTSTTNAATQTTKSTLPSTTSPTPTPRLRPRPILSLNAFERMIDIFEKATGFETTVVTRSRAERLVTRNIPEILRVFGSGTNSSSGKPSGSSSSSSSSNNNTITTVAGIPSGTTSSVVTNTTIDIHNHKTNHVVLDDTSIDTDTSTGTHSSHPPKPKSRSRTTSTTNITTNNNTLASSTATHTTSSPKPGRPRSTSTAVTTTHTNSTSQTIGRPRSSSVNSQTQTSVGGNSTTTTTTTTTPKHPSCVRAVISEVYEYWLQKRLRRKKPLVRRYWPVTSCDDTNPHLVFRPREKEKYKLRKKRQNDLDAYRKMKQLLVDFKGVRVLLELVKRREEVKRHVLDLQCDWFDGRVYDMVDTSGLPRVSDRLPPRDELDRLVGDVPRYFDTQGMENVKGIGVGGGGGGGKKKKRRRTIGGGSRRNSPTPSSAGSTSPMVVSQQQQQQQQQNQTQQQQETNTQPQHSTTNPSTSTNITDPTTNPLYKPLVADQDNPPLYLHPLKSRESYLSTWEHAVPFIDSYVDSHPVPTFRFRHRSRVGRGGRIVVDRLPRPGNPDHPPMDVFRTGESLPMVGTTDSGWFGLRSNERRNANPSKTYELFSTPSEREDMQRRIEEISAAALEEEELEASASMGGGGGDDGDKGVEEVLVRMSDWLETDEQLWGEERFTIGPV